MVYRKAPLKSQENPFESEAAQGNLLATESALKVCDEEIQIYGGYGYGDEFDVHRHWRDARLMTIGEGTSEIMRLIISDRKSTRLNSSHVRISYAVFCLKKIKMLADMWGIANPIRRCGRFLLGGLNSPDSHHTL